MSGQDSQENRNKNQKNKAMVPPKYHNASNIKFKSEIHKDFKAVFSDVKCYIERQVKSIQTLQRKARGRKGKHMGEKVSNT